MSVVRMNITIPEELANEIKKITGPRGKSQFITEALERRIKEIQKERVQKELEEGYKSRREESLAMVKEFEAVDLEGWDEY
ncbi:MAG: hypothetical protein QXS54_10590 [Candidatus Methanomethylicaceae archaeon]